MINGSGGAGTQSTDLALTLYRQLRARGASSLRQVASEMDLSEDDLARCREELIGLGLVVRTGQLHASRLEPEPREAAETDVVTVIAPEIALLRLLERERTRLRHHLEQADRAHHTLKTLAGNFLRTETLARAVGVEIEILHDYRRIQQVLEDITVTVQATSPPCTPSRAAGRSPSGPWTGTGGRSRRASRSVPFSASV